MREPPSDYASTLSAKRRVLRVGVLVSHPIQYFTPVYRELAKRNDIDLTVIYRTRVGVDAYHDPGFGQAVKWDIPLLDGYGSLFLSDKKTLGGIEPNVIGQLLRLRLDVLIVHGYNYPTNLLAVAAAKLIGTRVIIRGDTRLQAHHDEAGWWKRTLKKVLLKTFDGYLSIGSLNKQYYAAFGAQAGRIFFAPFCVDNAAFTLERDVRRTRREHFRTDLGIPPDAVVILFLSKLTKRKRPKDLLRAFAELTRDFPAAWLVFGGSGEQEQPLIAETAELGLEQVRFIGFQNQSALPTLFAASDIFVLPSDEEPWGLVVNEAMAAGLPVIVSDEVGAAPDLVEDKGTGAVYPCGNVEALTNAIIGLLESKTKRLEMGARAHELIKAWDVEKCVAGIASAARTVA